MDERLDGRELPEVFPREPRPGMGDLVRELFGALFAKDGEGALDARGVAVGTLEVALDPRPGQHGQVADAHAGAQAGDEASAARDQDVRGGLARRQGDGEPLGALGDGGIAEEGAHERGLTVEAQREVGLVPCDALESLEKMAIVAVMGDEIVGFGVIDAHRSGRGISRTKSRAKMMGAWRGLADPFAWLAWRYGSCRARARLR